MRTDVEVPGTDVVACPGIVVTIYPVIGEPPLDTGGDQLTVTDSSPATDATFVGGIGGPTGVAGDPGARPAVTRLEVPRLFVAPTVIV